MEDTERLCKQNPTTGLWEPLPDSRDQFTFITLDKSQLQLIERVAVGGYGVDIMVELSTPATLREDLVAMLRRHKRNTIEWPEDN